VNALQATHFYRYQTCEHLDRLERILFQNELYFPTAAQLNDPADCRPRIKYPRFFGTLRFLMRTWRRAHPDARLRDVVKEYPRAIGGLNRFGMKRMHQEMTKALHSLSEKTRVLSMSKRWDNMNLWAKYADNHTGYCLEFANTGIFTKALEVEYGDVFELDVTALTAARDAFPLFVRKKKADWSNEDEIRLVGPTLAEPRVRIEPAWLTRIILGKDMRPEHRDLIRRWAGSRNPPLPAVQAEYDAVEQILKLVR